MYNANFNKTTVRETYMIKELELSFGEKETIPLNFNGNFGFIVLLIQLVKFFYAGTLVNINSNTIQRS